MLNSNIEIFEIEYPDDVITLHVKIFNVDGSFTSMTKAEYDRQQAEQSTPNLPGLFNE
jgi:hypothetical protein